MLLDIIMKKTIKRLGKDSLGIIFNKEEVKIYKLKFNKVVDLSDMVITDEIVEDNK